MNKTIRFALVIVAMTAFWKCTTVPPKVQAPAPSPAQPAMFDIGGFIVSHVTLNMVRIIPGDLCPNALQADGKFWPALIKATIQAESGGDPNLGYTEKFTDGLTKQAAVSVGLLQLSVGDKLNYKTPYCQKLTAVTIKDPETNLGCGMEIMDALITRRPGNSLRVMLGGGNGHVGYWSTIKNHKIDADMKAMMPECWQ